MHGVGIRGGRDWLRVGAWGFALVLAACGGTSRGGASQESGGNTNQAGGGGSTGGGAGVPAGGGGALGGMAAACSSSTQPMADSACPQEGQICAYPGNPCGPPGFKYTCTGGKWKLTYEGGSVGVCLPEACPFVNPATGCPYSVPTQGMICGGECLMKASCQYAQGSADCVAGVWQVQSSGGAGGAGGSGENNVAGATDEAGGWGGAP